MEKQQMLELHLVDIDNLETVVKVEYGVLKNILKLKLLQAGSNK
tara:strand:- start:74 stop:205 length:132 start_codon:yes stop_codon:yes gene_type:complete